MRRGLDLEASAVPLGYQCLVASCLGWREEASHSARRILDMAGSVPILAVTAADALARGGDPAVAEAESRPGWLAPTHTAITAAALGDTDGAVTWLERALGMRCVWLPMVQCDPRLEGIRSDPRVLSVFEEVRARPI